MFNKMIIYKNNLINNIKQVKAENLKSKVCAMVKANAYGVGEEHVVKVLEDYVDFFGVACFFEAQKIRNMTNKKILIFGAVEKEQLDERFSYSCGDLEDLKNLISSNKRLCVHLKINTGMNRYGFKDLKVFKKVLNMIKQSNLILEGVYTHFASADDFVHEQMQRFKKFIKICHVNNLKPLIHADNSKVSEFNNHKLDMVRIGFNLYNKNGGWYLPVVEIKSYVAQIQEVTKGDLVGYDYKFVAKENMRVAILPVGYADGFDSKLAGMDLVIDGVKCKILNICMDCFMLDVTKVNVKKGDEIFILNKFNSLKDYATYLNASEYEIMTKFSYIRAERLLY